MNKQQEKATRSLRLALKKCAEASLGVYIFDGSVSVCPQPEGRNCEKWNESPSGVIDKIGESLFMSDLDSDGGSGW